MNNLRNSIASAIDDLNSGMITTSDTIENIILLVMVDSWSHTRHDLIKVDDLTDSEYYILDRWARLTRHNYANWIDQVKDIREVFPGLSLTAANYFCRS